MKGRTQQYNDARKLEMIKEIQRVGRKVLEKKGNMKFAAYTYKGKKVE